MLSDCHHCGVHLGDAGNPEFYELPHQGTPPFEFCPYCGEELDHDAMDWWEDMGSVEPDTWYPAFIEDYPMGAGLMMGTVLSFVVSVATTGAAAQWYGGAFIIGMWAGYQLHEILNGDGGEP